jgi:hypothetical protein
MSTERRGEFTVDQIGRGQITLGGHDVSRLVRALAVESEVGQVTVVRLELIAGVIARSTGRVDVDPETATLLAAAGWTPPDTGEPVAAADAVARALIEGWQERAARALARLDAVRATFLEAVRTAEDAGDGTVRVSLDLIREVAAGVDR